MSPLKSSGMGWESVEGGIDTGLDSVTRLIYVRWMWSEDTPKPVRAQPMWSISSRALDELEGILITSKSGFPSQV